MKNLKNIIFSFSIIAVASVSVLLAMPAAAEDMSYTLLAPLPGLTTTLSDNNILGTYVPAIFKLAVGISITIAVLMVVIGGFQYMSSDALMKKEEGKKRIQNSISALLLILFAWLILYTINPNLIKMDLDIKPATTVPTGVTLGGELSAGTGGVLAGYTLTQEQIDLNNKMRADLLNQYGIKTNAGPCANGETSGCTNLVGMPTTTYTGLINLDSICPDCNIMITGGTEGGHASHGPNRAPVDLGFDTNLNNFVTDQNNQIAAVQQTSLGPLYTIKIGDRKATFLKESTHWHVVFQ